ncbi:hypothetical protein ABPG72_010917 [Tetrahymena utriculariae]
MSDKDGISRLPANLQVNTNPLFSFDLNFDSLKSFLDKISNTINQHAELINALQLEIQTRETRKVLPEQLSIISEGGKIMDNNLANVIKNQIAKSVRPENTGDNLANQTNKIFNKLTGLGYAVAYNYNSNLEFPARFLQIEKEIQKKAVKEEVKEKHKKLKVKVSTEIEEIKKYFEKKVVDLDTKYATKINQFEDKVQAIEKKTLWKIQDCEEMMKKRITEDYVDDSIKALEDKIRREVITLAQSDTEKIERLSAEIISKMKIMGDSQAEKLKQIKKQIKDLEDLVNSTCTKQPVFEDYKKIVNAALQELQKKQKELEKSQDIMPILERQNIRIKATDDRLNDLSQNLSQRIQDMTNQLLNNQGSNKKGGEVSVLTNNVDAHKLCQIEGDLNRALEDLKKQQVDIDQIKNNVLIKLQNIDLSVYEAGMNNNSRSSAIQNAGSGMQELLDQFRQQMNEMQNMRNRNGGDDEDKIRKLISDVKDINKKMESIKDLEKRLSRVFKEFDIGTMAKQLKQKADQDDVLKDFAIVDTKVNTNSEQIGYCRKDIDNLILLYKKLLQALQQNNSHGDINSIITTKKLTPFNQLNACLSCGLSKNLQATQPGRGIDGKNYKVDLTITNDNTSFVETRNIAQYTSTPNMPQSTKLQRPQTASVRNDTQNQQQQLFVAGTQNKNTLQLEHFTYLLSEGMDKPKDTLGFLQDEHQKENINSYNKFGNRSGLMNQQDNPRTILSQSSVNAPNILQPSQLSQNQYKSNNEARENIYRQSIDLKNSQVLPQLKDRAISQKERKAASQEKESLSKQHQVRNIIINKDLNQFQNEQRRQSQIQEQQAKPMESGLQFNNINLQTPRSREENSVTTKDSLGIYLSSQKKLQKIQTSPSDKAVNQLNSQFQSLNDFKDNFDEGRKQAHVFNQSNKKLSQPNPFNLKKDAINEDMFVNIDVSLNTLAQQKTKNIYSRAQTAQENQVSDNGIKRDSQTIDVESLETAPNINNINVGLIQDQKLILNHLKKQSQNSQQSEKPQQLNSNQNKDYDGANITFYPKQSSKKNINKISKNDQSEVQQELQYQTQQLLRQKSSTGKNHNKESYNETKNKTNECSVQYNINQSNQKNATTAQKIEEISRRPSCQNQQINLKNPLTLYQQKNQMIHNNEVEVYQQQTEPNAIQTQPDFCFNNQCNTSKQYILSEGQQFEQIEQIPKNQMKFHNLYQKNISHSKNNSLSQGLPTGAGINFLEQQSSNQQNQNIYNCQNNLKNSQLSQQRASNYVSQIKRQINQQGQQQIDLAYPIPQGHHRSNSHHLDNKISKPNSFLMTNQFEGQLKEGFKKELKSIRGNNDRCNLSFDQRTDDFTSNQYYSDNKQRYLSTNQHELLISKQKSKRNESADMLDTNIQSNPNNADMSRFIINKNNQNSKNITSIQCTTALKSDKLMLNQQLNQIQQTFATSLTQNNQLSGINQVKKLSDICLPSLDQQAKQRNESLNPNQTKKITLSSLKIQPNSQLNQNSQPIQLCIDKFTFNTQKNVIKPSSKNYQNQNLNITDNKVGQFGYTLNANQIRQVISENNNQQNEPSTQILKKSVLSKNNETSTQAKPSNIESDQQEQANNQILEETGRFGQEQITESQKKNNQKQLMINLNENNKSTVSKLKYQKNDLTSQFPNTNFNQRQLRNSLVGIQADQNQQKQIKNIQLYNHSGLLMTDGPDILSSQNPHSIINIPVITTNFGLNNSQGITKPNADSLNQGTLLIHYNFPLAESMQYRSKYQQNEQKQISDIQNNYINYTQKKVSSAISCKRKDDFYSQFDGTGNDILDKQQRARSSNNRFPREIFTPNVQKAKRLNSQNKQNLNFNNCINQEQQNEFIQQSGAHNNQLLLKLN